MFLGAGFSQGGLVCAWTFYPPITSIKYSPSLSVDYAAFSILLTAFGSVLSTLNLMCTIKNMRSLGMGGDYKYIPLSVYGTLLAALLFTFVAPILGTGLLMLFIDRHFYGNYFNVTNGGDIVLYQHLFWFFGHPEVYVLLLPVFGYVSNIIIAVSRKVLFGYDHMVMAMLGICVLGAIVWGHHMYVGGLNKNLRNIFTATSLFVGIPSILKLHA